MVHKRRIKIHSMPAKDGKSELMLTEDIGTGEMQIKKIGKEGDEMTTEVQNYGVYTRIITS
jgi:hypothetical protein